RPAGRRRRARGPTAARARRRVDRADGRARPARRRRSAPALAAHAVGRAAAARHGAEPAAGHLALAPRDHARGVARARERHGDDQRHHAPAHGPAAAAPAPVGAGARRRRRRRRPRRRRDPGVRGDPVSTKRAPSPPPEITGFEYVSLIGSGGFSDVFLYQQQRPRRRVAIKVLLHEWSSHSQRAAFDAEADLMATLSTHPSIVTMYEADIADDGRPYLAMEYCSRPNLGARYRSE